MKVGIDSYCYHRFFGEVYPDQSKPAKNMTMQDFLRGQRSSRWTGYRSNRASFLQMLTGVVQRFEGSAG